jgi:predicted TIM-barrel fold metal-dependent hydrolase
MMKDTQKRLVIDCHGFLGTGTTWADPPREVDYQAEALFAHDQDAGIDRHCVMPPRNDTYTQPNKLVARMCEKHPDKLIGFVAHSPQREAGQLRRLLVEEVKSMGLRGVRSDGPPTRELLDAALELNIPVMYYPGPGKWQELGAFYHMPATAYPKVNFIIPHIGQYCSWRWPPHIEAIELASRYSNVYLDMSGIGSFKYVEMAARELAAEKLLFGCCAPEQDPRVAREGLRLLKLPPDRHARVAGLNFLALISKKPA